MSRSLKETSSSRKRCNAFGHAPIFATCMLVIYVHLAFVSRNKTSISVAGSSSFWPHSVHESSAENSTELPDVIIYRRTKKTGSSSMLEQILKVTNPLGYVAFYDGTQRMWDLVHTASFHDKPSRFIVAEHNSITRDDVPGKRTIIIDTVIDGYRQMTAHCRFVYKVKNCDEELRKCLQRNHRENLYRWAGRSREDPATYIDLPLSSLHPALSTTIIRRVFPNAILDVRHLNAAQSACPDDPKIKKVYHDNFSVLEKQVNDLRSRMLTLAGYPSRIHGNASFAEVLDKAEEMEKKKYWEKHKIKFGTHEKTKHLSKEHGAIKYRQPAWTEKDGEIVIELK